MSAITRRVEWVKLRDLPKHEEEAVRKRFNLNGARMNTQKIQVTYTDQRIDSYHAPDCEWPRTAENEMRLLRDADLERFDVEAFGGRVKRYDGWFEDGSGATFVPQPCTCGLKLEESWDVDVGKPRYSQTLTYVRPHLGLYATVGTSQRFRKGEVPQLVRFVPRPLTLADALRYEEVEDVGAMRVEADMRLERGERIGEVIAVALKSIAALLLCVLFTGCDTVDRALPDGGIEYMLPDGGGWVTKGDPCGCENLQTQLIVEYPRGSRVVLECMPAEGRDGRDGRVGVCFGDGCCVWTAAQGAP